jgi:hypothetical protein
MTKVISPARAGRIAKLRKIPSRFKGLSCEPLFAPLDLNLTTIDWLIMGGGSDMLAEPFQVEWALFLRQQCRKANAVCSGHRAASEAHESPVTAALSRPRARIGRGGFANGFGAGSGGDRACRYRSRSPYSSPARESGRSGERPGRLLGGDVGVDANGDDFAVNLHTGFLVAMGTGHDEGFAGRAGGGLFQGQRQDEISVNDFSFHNDFVGAKCAD